MTNTPPSNTLGALLIDNARLLRRRFDDRARAMGLTRAQWNVLVHLARSEGINQAGLADLMEVEPITVGRQLDRMEEAGWITRVPDPADRRIRRVHMTDKAKGVLGHMRELAQGVYAEALKGFDDAAREALIEGLTRLRANLGEPPGEEVPEAEAPTPPRRRGRVPDQ
jgi:DNA-binding MarR family transcriptional regulator